MKTVHIVGVGMNGATTQAEAAIASCEVLLGAPRQLEMFSDLGKPAFPEYAPDAVRRIIEGSDAESFAVLVSGDVGFYSGARAIAEDLTEYDVRMTAGVSSVSDFCAKLRLPWQDAALVSMHGVGGPLVSAVRRNKLTFCLTGGNTEEIREMLMSAGFGGVIVHVGENLGYPNEAIFTVKASELRRAESMTVLLIVNGDYDASVPSGLPDTAFERVDGVPMTKSEVRAVIASKLRLSPYSVCYDIGAGTGSVTAEMALAAYNGQVYAIERNRAAARLIPINCAKLHIGNVSLVEGFAPDALEGLPPPDAAFIGGSGGKLPEIISAILAKNQNARLVTSAIAIESAMSAIKVYEGVSVPDIEVVQLGVSRAVKRGGLHMLTAQNPIFIVSGGGV